MLESSISVERDGGEVALDSLLSLENIKVAFPLKGKFPWSRESVRAVDGVSLRCEKGDVLGIVGESGCGKTTLANVIMRVLKPTEGRVLFEGEDHAKRTGTRTKELYRSLQMVFQDPFTSLNPVLSAGGNVMEPLRIQRVGNAQERRDRALKMMAEVGLRADQFNRKIAEFSGGQLQRIAIARALVLQPKLVVLDEPVSSLDVSIQAQVVNLLLRLQREFDLTYIFVSHDLAVVRYICNRVAVMYLGKIVEVGPANKILSQPSHPYTRALLDAIPIPDPHKRRPTGEAVLKGEVPSPLNPPNGCRFHPRCPWAQSVCATKSPEIRGLPGGNDHSFACHFPLGETDAIPDLENSKQRNKQ